MDFKAFVSVKANLGADPDELAGFYAGRRPGRVLTIPFGGPIPSKAYAKGIDVDGEYFHEGTDPFVHRVLRQDRERMVDWHHAARPPSAQHGDPTKIMAGVFLGKSTIDLDPDEYGWWSDLWLDAGEKRLALVARLRERGAQIFGSSQPAPGSVSKTGPRIDAWAHMIQTLSTSPQNTLSVVQAKAYLDQMPIDQALVGVRAVLSALSNLETSPAVTSIASDEAKAERELSEEDEARLEEFAARLRATGQVADEMRR